MHKLLRVFIKVIAAPGHRKSIDLLMNNSVINVA